MSIDLPIPLPNEHPIERPESPYGKCGHCEYVGIEMAKCCGCGMDLPTGGSPWPRPELIGLWDDQVAMWNDRRPELAVVTACTYAEASLFDLMWWAAGWLDAELNWIGADVGEAQQKEEAVREYLGGLRTRQATDEALQRLFGASGRQMLEHAIGRTEGTWFWNNYRQMAETRNDIVHRGGRLIYRAAGSRWLVHKDADAILRWCLEFVPRCWVVFSRLWNEYIHKPMFERVASEGT